MNFVPTKRERLILENPVDPRIIRREIPWNKVRKGTPWNRIVAVLRNPEFAAVVMLCAIGLLVTTSCSWHSRTSARPCAIGTAIFLTLDCYLVRRDQKI